MMGLGLRGRVLEVGGCVLPWVVCAGRRGVLAEVEPRLGLSRAGGCWVRKPTDDLGSADGRAGLRPPFPLLLLFPPGVGGGGAFEPTRLPRRCSIRTCFCFAIVDRICSSVGGSSRALAPPLAAEEMGMLVASEELAGGGLRELMVLLRFFVEIELALVGDGVSSES
jgi:hypothetical protein